MNASSHSVQARAGIGLRTPHHPEALAARVADWLEVHPENFLVDAEATRQLELIRATHPLSLHAIGLSLGSADGVDEAQLKRLRDFARRLQPGLLSDHLSWSRIDGRYYPDLLPLPYNDEALSLVVANVGRAQEILGRQLLIENPSTYLDYALSDSSEAEFLAELVRRSGCGLLFDVNNVYVSARNQQRDPARVLDEYLRHLPADAIGEMHLAGHAVKTLADGAELRIDDHAAPVCEAVWELYRQTVRAFGARPTLIEWDSRLPALAVLQAEAAQAQRILDEEQAQPRTLRAPPSGGAMSAPGTGHAVAV